MPVSRPWYRRSRGGWFATVHGHQVPLGVSDPDDFRGAIAALTKLLTDQAEAARPPKPSGRLALPVPDAVAAYLLERQPHLAAATFRRYASYLGHLAKRHPDAASVTALTPEAIVERAAAEPWGPTNRANYLAAVELVLRWAGRADYRLPKPPRESRGADAVFPDAVYRGILRETRGDFRQLCRFLRATGCRPAEATQLRADQVDLATRTARLRQHKTRNRTGKVRVLYLSEEAIDVCREQAEVYAGAGFLFRGEGGRPFTIQAMVMRFHRLSAKLGHAVTAYGFRHTYATEALLAGEPDAVVAALLGHQSTRMIHKHYSHVSQQGQALAAAAERIAAKPKAG